MTSKVDLWLDVGDSVNYNVNVSYDWLDRHSVSAAVRTSLWRHVQAVHEAVFQAVAQEL